VRGPEKISEVIDDINYYIKNYTMIKDPLNTQETPYDILDLDMNIPMSDIHQALPRFMKKNKVVSKISIAQEAIRKLKSIQDRITFDITYYALDFIESSSVSSLCDIPVLVSKQISVPVLSSPDYIRDFMAEKEHDNLLGLTAMTVKIEDFSDYLVQNEEELLMPFERREYHSDN
jgi:hypothetical protein